jgi:hypothetical protein
MSISHASILSIPLTFLSIYLCFNVNEFQQKKLELNCIQTLSNKI